MTSEFEQKLEKYAELIIKVGLNLQPEQRLFILAYSLDVAPLVRQVTASAYKQGSRLVTVIWLDEQLDRIRHQYAPRDSFEEFPEWEAKGAIHASERGDALVSIRGSNPELLSDQDPELVTLATNTRARHFKPLMDTHVRKNLRQWLVVCPPTPDWATKVFPQEAPEKAYDLLWEAVFKATRLDQPDPVAFWQQQIVELGKRTNYLNKKQYQALHFKGSGTDLKIGLPKGHIWGGGSSQTPAKVAFAPNIPTEEVFTMPHKDRIDGTVSATKPLAYQGRMVRNFKLTFADGKVVSYSADEGEEVLRSILETDEGAKSLGEVALIPHRTPISQMGILFLNTLYDENASDHLALGAAYRTTLEGGTAMTEEEFVKAGGNVSLIHVDFMFGSGEMDVDGLLPDGTTEAVVRTGEWAFEV